MKPIRFAFVGLGAIAKTHIVALRALPVIMNLPYVPVLDTLVTRNPDEKRAQAEAMGFKHVVSSLDEALESRDIDVVDICTPNAMHFEDAMKAANAGKAIYLEKPLTERYESSQQLTSRISEKITNQVALVYRFHPGVIRIREALRLGLIGEALQCQVSYRRSGYLNAERPVSWRLSSDVSGGGAITDLGVHVLDVIRHLLGEIDSVKGSLNTFVKRRPTDATLANWVDMKVDDYAMMNVKLASGLEASAEVSRIAWGSEAFEINIYGTKGSITCDLEKEYFPNIRMLDGSSPAAVKPQELSLVPDDKTTMGMSLDCHLGGLNHFLHRLSGDRRFNGLAPQVQDCLIAEYWIDQVLKDHAKK
ncbi:oxidoreductase [Paenibacillus swuensis]|uniref:Oxidoreductase n=1 Tax=Paenibacillus swuensis TaxID=1178515 RepID=A0A172TLB4_9BACL|nr:Gfo/Idh/MocA family oxidoreductase [Paenibacillus swuensis]ANE47859.1 oxidoreductase [Paenibacillus swuensis]